MSRSQSRAITEQQIMEAGASLDEHAQYLTHPDMPYNPHALAVAAAAEIFRTAYTEAQAALGAAPLIEFVVECPKCGEPASAGTTYFADWEPGKPLRVDLEMSGTQEQFLCTNSECGVPCYSGDLAVFADADGDDQ